MTNEIKSSEMAEELDVDAEVVEQVLQRLVEDGWLLSQHVLLDAYRVE